MCESIHSQGWISFVLYLSLFLFRIREQKITFLHACLSKVNLNQTQSLAGTVTWLLSTRVVGGVYRVTEPAVSLKQETPRDRSE